MSLTYLDNEELRTEQVGDSIYFEMDELEVDGIKSVRRSDFAKQMFTLKYEFDVYGRPSDTGQQFNWSPNFNISEKHWLSCGRVIREHSQCGKCGERD